MSVGPKILYSFPTIPPAVFSIPIGGVPVPATVTFSGDVTSSGQLSAGLKLSETNTLTLGASFGERIKYDKEFSESHEFTPILDFKPSLSSACTGSVDIKATVNLQAEFSIGVANGLSAVLATLVVSPSIAEVGTLKAPANAKTCPCQQGKNQGSFKLQPHAMVDSSLTLGLLAKVGPFYTVGGTFPPAKFRLFDADVGTPFSTCFAVPSICRVAPAACSFTPTPAPVRHPPLYA